MQISGEVNMADQLDSGKWAMESIVEKAISDLKPFEDNPRIHSTEQITAIKRSISEWGFTIPILIDEENMILAGHGRVQAAAELEMQTLPCLIASGWSDHQKRAYIIADNKIYEKGNWDYGAIFRQMKELSSEFDISLIDADLDLSNFSYEPEINPSFDPAEISQQDISNSADRLDAEFQSRIRPPDVEEVICPHCGAEFELRR